MVDLHNSAHSVRGSRRCFLLRPACPGRRCACRGVESVFPRHAIALPVVHPQSETRALFDRLCCTRVDDATPANNGRPMRSPQSSMPVTCVAFCVTQAVMQNQARHRWVWPGHLCSCSFKMGSDIPIPISLFQPSPQSDPFTVSYPETPFNYHRNGVSVPV